MLFLSVKKVGFAKTEREPETVKRTDCKNAQCNTRGFHQIIIATIRERKQANQNTKQQISGYFHINFLCFFTCGSQQSQPGRSFGRNSVSASAFSGTNGIFLLRSP